MALCQLVIYDLVSMAANFTQQVYNFVCDFSSVYLYFFSVFD